jgi:hypothetical protein
MKYVTRYVPDVLLCLFAALFCFGLSLVSLPAALCVGGALGAVYAVLAHEPEPETSGPGEGL